MTQKIFADYDMISDLATNRPATPTVAGGRLCVFQATDTGDVSIWDGTAWRLITSLNTYQEGTWTPVDGSGEGVTMGVVYATYTLTGRVLALQWRYAPAGGTTVQATVSGLPFSVAARSQAGTVITSAGVPVDCSANNTVVTMVNSSSGAAITNATLSGQAVIPSVIAFRT